MSEQLPTDPVVHPDMECIGVMLKKAQEHGLLTEVVWSFGLSMTYQMSVEHACDDALHEWDI
jgi:hypothetical protein